MLARCDSQHPIELRRKRRRDMDLAERNAMRARSPHVASTVNLEDVCPEDGRVVKFSVSMHRLPNHYNISCKREAKDKFHCQKEWEVSITLGWWEVSGIQHLPEFKITWKEV